MLVDRDYVPIEALQDSRNHGAARTGREPGAGKSDAQVVLRSMFEIETHCNLLHIAANGG